jgi:hypothetical protein
MTRPDPDKALIPFLKMTALLLFPPKGTPDNKTKQTP